MVNDKTDAVVYPYTRRQVPALEESFRTFLPGELQQIERSIKSLADAVPQVAEVAPDKPRKGMVRYAMSPWNPLGNGQEGLVVYNGTAWKGYAKVEGDTFTGAVTVQGAFTSKGIDDNASSTSMTIDSSGNLLVGQSSTALPGAGNTTTGISVSGQYDAIFVSRSSASGLVVNRNSDDGDMVQFRKDGTTVGRIGAVGGSTYVSGSTNGVRFLGARVQPCNTSGSLVDNVMDFGYTTSRWDDIYATNGSIQTSDRNEKQDIEELTEAEKRVAIAAKGLLRKFRWKSAVAEKGDNARTHFGIIAQDLQAAFAAEGLDAGKYGMFVSSTWWEHQVEVPAVEADEEKGIEAKDAYTRTDTYDTAEEAPSGATQRTRLGVRYSELLSFIIAA